MRPLDARAAPRAAAKGAIPRPLGDDRVSRTAAGSTSCKSSSSRCENMRLRAPRPARTRAQTHARNFSHLHSSTGSPPHITHRLLCAWRGAPPRNGGLRVGPSAHGTCSPARRSCAAPAPCRRAPHGVCLSSFPPSSSDPNRSTMTTRAGATAVSGPVVIAATPPVGLADVRARARQNAHAARRRDHPPRGRPRHHPGVRGDLGPDGGRPRRVHGPAALAPARPRRAWAASTTASSARSRRSPR